MGTDVDAQAAEALAHARAPSLHVPVAGVSVVPGFAGLGSVEAHSGESPRRADVHALAAAAAALSHGRADLEGRVGEHCAKAHARPVLGRDEQAALSDPAEACQVGGQLVRERPRELRAVDDDVEHGPGAKAGLLDAPGQGEGDRIESAIDYVVQPAVGADGDRVLVAGQRVHCPVYEPYAKGDRPRPGADDLAALGRYRVAPAREVGDSEQGGSHPCCEDSQLVVQRHGRLLGRQQL